MRDRTVPKSLDVQRTKREDAARSERQDASIAVQDLLRNGPTKPNAVLDALFEPQEFNCREVAHGDVFRRVAFGSVSCLFMDQRRSFPA